MSDALFWTAVPLLAIGTFALRSMFLTYFVASEPSREWARILRYAPVAVLPAIAAPGLVFDSAGALQSDPVKIVAAIIAVGVGLATRNVLWPIIAGMTVVWTATFAPALL